MSVFSWFGQMFLKLQAAANLSEASLETEAEPSGCQIFADALDQAGIELDALTDRISTLLDQYWACRKSAQTVSELSMNTTQQSVNGAKLLLTTAANRVRQVVDEIEIVTRQDSTDGN